MHAIVRLAIVALVAGSTPAFGQIDDFDPVTDEMLLNPDPADWLMINRTFDQQRFSPLDRIDRGNVSELALAWVRGLPGGVQESTPIIYDGVMFLIEPGPACSRSMPPMATASGRTRTKYPTVRSGTSDRPSCSARRTSGSTAI